MRGPEGNYVISLNSNIVVGDTIGTVTDYYNNRTDTLEVRCETESATRISVRNGEEVTLTITVPRFFLFQAMLLDAGSTPVPHGGAAVEIHGLSSEPCIYHTDTGGTGGLFIRAPDGSSFTLRVTASGRDIGWYDGAGFTADRAGARTLTLRGADITGIEIRLPVALDGG